MHLPARLPFRLALVVLLATVVLVAPRARGEPLSGVHGGALAARARGIPAALSLLPANTNVESPSLPVEPGPQAEPTQREPAPAPTPATTSPHLREDAPVSAGAWMAYGSSALVPLAGVYGASHVGGERLWVTAVETAAGSVAGMLPGTLLFLQPAQAGGRWAELDVAGFGAGLVLTPPLAALGTWGLGELAFNGSQDRGRAYLGALGGAAAGTLLGLGVHGLLEEVVGNTDQLKAVRKYIALGFIGSGATVGYQWARGEPRQR